MAERIGNSGKGDSVGENISPTARERLDALQKQLEAEGSGSEMPPTTDQEPVDATDESTQKSSTDESIQNQIDAAWAGHNAQESTEVPEPNSEIEKPLSEQCSDYLLEHRLLKKLDSVVKAKERAYTTSGGSMEDFRKTIWSQYRDVLHEKGIIPDKDLGNFNPGLVREIIQGARQKSKELDSRKKDIAAALASKPELLKKISRGIDSDKNGYVKDNEGSIEGWDVRIAAEAAISPLLEQLGPVSEFDAYMHPGDFMGMLSMAQSAAKVQRSKASSNVDKDTAAPQFPNEVPPTPEEMRAAEAQQSIIDHIKKDPDAYSKINELAKAKQQSAKAAGAPISRAWALRDAMIELELFDPKDEGHTSIDNKAIISIMNQAKPEQKATTTDGQPVRPKQTEARLPNRFDQADDGFDDYEGRREQDRVRLQREREGMDPAGKENALPEVNLPNDPLEALTIAQQEEQWMDLAGQYGASSGDAELRKKATEAYNKLQEMRSSPETLARLEAELGELRQQYGLQTDKSSPAARQLVAAAAAKFSELESLRKWQDDHVRGSGLEQRQALPELKLPDDPLNPRGPLPELRLPQDPLSAKGRASGDDTELARLRQAYLESPNTETQKALHDYMDGKHSPTKAFNQLQEKFRQEHAAQVSEIRAQVAALGEGGVTYGERLDAALRSYAKLKAIDETRNGDIKLFGRWTIYPGRAKREARLKERENEVFAAKMAYEQAVQAKMAEAKLYLGNEEQVKAQQRNDLLTRVRELDKATRDATNDALDAREAKGSFWRKAAVGIGNWLRGGNKVTKWLKAGGTGAGAVLLPTVMGAGWPITSTVALGASLATRYSVKTAALDEQRKASRHDRVMSDADFEQLRASSERNDDDSQFAATLIAKDIFNKSRDAGHERVDKANKETSAVMGKFAIGALAAGAARFGWEQLGSHNAAAAAVPEHNPDGAGNDMTGKSVRGGKLHVDHTFEWSRGASRITSGEGWFHQFQDMGMSSKQAHALFADDSVMKQLEKVGAAYADNSSKIGGYGINMPANGHLSEKAMDIIGKAMKAKGF